MVFIGAAASLAFHKVTSSMAMSCYGTYDKFANVIGLPPSVLKLYLYVCVCVSVFVIKTGFGNEVGGLVRVESI